MAMGRPTKITEEIIKEIETYLKAGNYIETAANIIGIHKSTLYDWLKRGRRALDEEAKTGKPIPESEELFARFSDAVRKAQAWSEARDLMTIGEHAKGDWKAAAWRLERKFPERWGRKDRVEAELKHSGSVEQNHTGEVAQKISTDPQALDLAMKLFEKVNDKGE